MPVIPFHNLLRSKVEEEINAELQRMAGGYDDYTVYRQAVGYLSGLRVVLTMADEIEKGMS